MFPLLCNFIAENNVSPINTLVLTNSTYLKNSETKFPNLFKKKNLKLVNFELIYFKNQKKIGAERRENQKNCLTIYLLRTTD